MPAVRTAFVVGLMTVGLLIAAAAAQSHAPATGWMHDFKQAEAEARRQNKPLLVHFYAEWCAPCKRMDREFLLSPELTSQFGRDFIAVKVNRDGNDALVERFSIRVLPSDVVVSPSGAVLARSQGYKDKQTYFAQLAAIGGRREQAPVQIVKESVPRVQPALPATPEEHPERSAAQIGLSGFCPVTLWNQRTWQRGRPEFSARYQDIVFFLASAEQVREFNASPGRYVPQLLGCDPVVLAETDRALAGTTRFAAYFDGELFLFSSESTRQRFRAQPTLYTRIRHVLRIDDIEPTRITSPQRQRVTF